MAKARKKMGRPKALDPRAYKVTIRLNADEFAAVSQRAEVLGIGLSTWVRAMVRQQITPK